MISLFSSPSSLVFVSPLTSTQIMVMSSVLQIRLVGGLGGCGAERGCSPETMWRRSKAPPLQTGRSRSEVTIAFNTSADNKQEAEHRVTVNSGLKVSSQTLRLIDLCAIQSLIV